MKIFLKYTIAISVLIFLLTNPSHAAMEGKEDNIVKAMTLYCLPPVIRTKEIAEYALDQKLLEYPPEKARVFTKRAGRVFYVPEGAGDAVLIALTEPGPVWQILIRVADPDRFWAAIDKHFGPDSRFETIKEETMPDGRKQKEMSAYFEGDAALFISLRPEPVKGGVQGIMSFSRVESISKTP